MTRPWFTATTANPSPKGFIHLPPRWWLPSNRLIYLTRSWDDLIPIRKRQHLYVCRSGSIWVGNNWSLYRIHLNPGPGPLIPPSANPDTGIWYYGGSPIALEPVTRLQLRMELLWTV